MGASCDPPAAACRVLVPAAAEPRAGPVWRTGSNSDLFLVIKLDYGLQWGARMLLGIQLPSN